MSYFRSLIDHMEKPFVFVLMPFAKEFDDVYKLGIKDACSAAGLYCERVDEQFFEERILDRIYNQINKADYLIADLSGKNANVFYEVGYAHCLKKNVVLLINNVKDIPFDLGHHPHIIYDSIGQLKDDLTKKMKWFVTHPSRKTLPNIQILQFYVNGEVVSEGKEIKFQLDDSPGNKIKLNVDINNASDLIFNDHIELGLQSGTIFKSVSNQVSLNDSENLILGGKISKMLPELWSQIQFELHTERRLEEGVYGFTLRIFSEVEAHRINFRINFYRKSVPSIAQTVSFGGKRRDNRY
jgi:hypothetical protein